MGSCFSGPEAPKRAVYKYTYDKHNNSAILKSMTVNRPSEADSIELNFMSLDAIHERFTSNMPVRCQYLARQLICYPGPLVCNWTDELLKETGVKGAGERARLLDLRDELVKANNSLKARELPNHMNRGNVRADDLPSTPKSIPCCNGTVLSSLFETELEYTVEEEKGDEVDDDEGDAEEEEEEEEEGEEEEEEEEKGEGEKEKEKEGEKSVVEDEKKVKSTNDAENNGDDVALPSNGDGPNIDGVLSAVNDSAKKPNSSSNKSKNKKQLQPENGVLNERQADTLPNGVPHNVDIPSSLGQKSNGLTASSSSSSSASGAVNQVKESETSKQQQQGQTAKWPSKMGEETEDKAGISESVKSESQISNSGSNSSNNGNGNNHSNNHSNSIAVPSISNCVDNGYGLATSDRGIGAIDKEAKEAPLFPHKPTSNGGAFPDQRLNPKSSASESETDPALRDGKEGFPLRKESTEDLPKKKEGGGGIARTPFPGLATGNVEGLTNGTSSQQQNGTAVAVVAAAAASVTGELGNLKTSVLAPSTGGLMASHVVTTAVMVPI